MVWAGAALGVLFRLFWNDAPRWLYMPIYVALGWAAVFFFGDFVAAAEHGGPRADVRRRRALHARRRSSTACKRPDPFPRWFGFHEVFHTLTIAAFVTHYVGVSLATYSLR